MTNTVYQLTLLDKIFNLMSDGKPRTLVEIFNGVGAGSQTGTSARIRDLRKPQYGGHRIDSWRDGKEFYYQYVKPSRKAAKKGK